MLPAEEERNGNMALATAMNLDERGTESGWEPGAKERAVAAYVLSAEVCTTLAGVFSCFLAQSATPVCRSGKHDTTYQNRDVRLNQMAGSTY